MRKEGIVWKISGKQGVWKAKVDWKVSGRTGTGKSEKKLSVWKEDRCLEDGDCKESGIGRVSKKKRKRKNSYAGKQKAGKNSLERGE